MAGGPRTWVRCHLSRGGTRHRSSSPPGPVVGRGRVPPLPWLYGGTWHGSPIPWPHDGSWQGGPSPVAGCCMVPPPQRTRLPLHGGTGSDHQAPRGSSLPVPTPCPLLPSLKQPSSGSILSLGSLGLEPLGEGSFAPLPNSADNAQLRFGARLTFGPPHRPPWVLPTGFHLRRALQAGAPGRCRLLRPLRGGFDQWTPLLLQRLWARPRARHPLGLPLPGRRQPGA